MMGILGMRIFAQANGAGCGRRGTGSVLRGIAAALALALVPAANATAQVSDTLPVINRATVTFEAGGFTAESEDVAIVVVKLTAGVSLAPPQSATVRPGERRVFAHRLQNMGTGPDRFRLSVTGPAGWAVSLYLDGNGDGVLGPEDTPVPGPLPLERGAAQALLLVVDVPADAPDDGAASVSARAASEMDPAVTATVTDQMAVHRPLPAVTLAKTVDRAEATPGDTLTWTLTAANRGDAAAPGATLADPLPTGTRYVPGSLRLNGAAMTDAADADAGQVVRGTDGVDRVQVTLGDLPPGANATVVVKAVVAADASGSLRNIGTLTYTLEGGAPVEVPSPAVGTAVAMPAVTLAKELIDGDSVRLGEQVRFRITFGNASASLPVRDAVLVDTLPAGLAFVSADLQPQVEGQVVTWRLGTLAPGQTGALVITARAVVHDGEAPVVNRATMRGANTEPVQASARALQLLGFAGNELEVAKSAGVLEAGLGDAVPYAVTLHNRGLAPLAGVVLHDTLPAGVAYLADRLQGADSARVVGRQLTVWWNGPLEPGASHVVRYAVSVVSPGRATTLVNVVWGQAAGGRVSSAAATAFVRLRRGFAVQQRVVVGKVWVDTNDDGRQQAGEPGAAGVEVWSEDGEVVTTDRQGRYSFPNLRSGSHALRIDTLGLPAGTGVARRGDEIVRVRLDGWTLPRADFRLVPRALAAAPTAPGASSVAASASRPTAIASGAAPSGPSAAIPSPAAPNAAVPTEQQPAAVSAQAATAPAIPSPSAPALAPAAVTADTAVAARVKPMRTEAEREDEAKQSFVTGPVVRFASPADGAVVSSNRLYVGLQGEPGAAVTLWVGAKQVGEGQLRPDGRIDFVGIELAPGPQTLRASMTGSFGTPRWDSVVVHRSGEPVKLEVPAAPLTMRAEDRDASSFRARALDRWGVPVAGGALVTVEARGARVESPDADLSSVGNQVRVRADGWLEVRLRPGAEVGPGTVRLASGDAKGALPLRILPSIRPLIVTGDGQVGVGAAPGAFGSVTARGSLDGETTVSVSFDSRRSDPHDDYFGRGYDPLDEGRYPTLGDGSSRRVLAGSTQTLSARVERGFDHLALGDVRTAEFGVDERLGYYQRALTGVAGRVTTGPLTWRGYGSMTDQVLSQMQMRGNGTSGPYTFGGGVRPGTDRVAVEVRALENAARVLSRQELQRYTDYQIDYTTGRVLLNHPVPATDGAGNPVFVVAMLERRTGGESRFVGGLRMDLDAAKVLGVQGFDSLGISVLGVRDGGDGSAPGQDRGGLVGGGLNLRRGGLSASAQLLRSLRPDSSAAAGLAEIAWTVPGDRFKLDAGWMSVGRGFAPGTDPRLSAGVRELRLGAEVKPAEHSRLRLSHQMQRFDGYGVERSVTSLRAEQTVAGHAVTAEGGLTSDAHGDASTRSGTARLGTSLFPGMDVWVEGSQLLSPAPANQPLTSARPDFFGFGAAVKAMWGMRFDASHRWVRTHGDSAISYQLSTLGVTTGRLLGAQLHGGIERANDNRAGNSAVLGWNQRLAMSGGWALTGMYERRFGLSRAPLLDPNRALPFAQVERNRWTAAAGVEYLPADSARARFSLRSELHGGQDGRGWRIDVGGDAPLGSSAALLMRHNWLRDDRTDVQGGLQRSRSDLSLLGLALRPAGSDALNLLAKVEWHRTVNPFGGGVLSNMGDDRRLIGATDAVWATRPGTELAARYAVRWSALGDSAAGAEPLTSFAHFVGMRADQVLRGPLRFRVDGRMLVDGQGGGSRWNLAPALVRDLGRGLELEGGYRFGELVDADFADQGGKGFYATLNLRFTEGLLGTVAEFWRQRITR